MAAYAAAAGMEALIFLPNGKIAFSKLAQALEYGAKTLQVEANFDQILALIRVLAERLGIYLLNSMNPFRVEGQKAIMFEMLDQRDWRVPDWVVLPGGNLGNTSAFGKGLREAKAAGLIDKLPRLAVIQAEGAAPFDEYWKRGGAGEFHAVKDPRDSRHRDPHRRSRVVAQSVVRSSDHQRHRRESHRARDRRRESADRTRGHRLRTRLCGDARWHQKTGRGRDHRQGRRRGRRGSPATS